MLGIKYVIKPICIHLVLLYKRDDSPVGPKHVGLRAKCKVQPTANHEGPAEE
jgi:hypothetical protein